MNPQPTRLVLKRPHTHAGKAFQAGDRIDVDHSTAQWLLSQGVAVAVADADADADAGQPQSVPATNEFRPESSKPPSKSSPKDLSKEIKP